MKLSWGYLPKISGKEVCITKLQEFWNKYPNGMIDFG